MFFARILDMVQLRWAFVMLSGIDGCMEHTVDRLGARWDRLSWFGLRRVTEDGKLADLPVAACTSDTFIGDLEAGLIEALEPPLIFAHEPGSPVEVWKSAMSRSRRPICTISHHRADSHPRNAGSSLRILALRTGGPMAVLAQDFRRRTALTLLLAVSCGTAGIPPASARPPEGPPPSAALGSAEIDGVGWRLRGRTLLHAMVGIEVTLPPGWNQGPHPAIPREAAHYGVQLIHPDRQWGIRVQAFPDRGLPAPVVLEEAEGLRDRSWHDVSAGGPMDVALGNRSVRLFARKEKSTDVRSWDWDVHWGTSRGEGRLLVLEVILPRRGGGPLPGPLLGALAAIRILAPEERAARVAEFADGEDPEAFLGEKRHLRRREYVDLGRSISWTKPDALWSLSPGVAGLASGAGPVTMAFPERGFTADLYEFRPVPGRDWRKAHDEYREKALESRTPGNPSKPVAAKLGGRTALRSDLRFEAAKHPFLVVVITTQPVRGTCFCLIITTIAGPGASGDVDAVLGGFRFLATLPPQARRIDGGWEDPVCGFRVKEMKEPVTAEELPTVAASLPGRGVVVHGKSSMLHVLVLPVQAGRAGLTGAQVLRELRRVRREPEEETGQEDPGPATAGVVCGVPSREWNRGGPPGGRLVVLQRDGLLYILESRATLPGHEADPLDWFSFIE